ncbi:MAG: thiamine phosphate synthase [Mageeibacillus sp.]|jgi:thiamine-phosphate pyrophosphorylase|nr:thiamine phosphate synthase [Mageeibacillus sp.]MCI1263729.1 thiamine phosphate synthase [Saccharofermentans sp.]MCI1769238.1 thiamine phosphate synthase [Mageeibacillus sp.]MCI2044607.1 thiamine phosphate synthase [Mageeibacillus sp.]
MRLDKKSLLVYLVTDSRWLEGRSLESQVEQAIEGGVSFVQLRQKDKSGAELADFAKNTQEVCRRHGVPFVINDDVDAAFLCGSDGVHVGQSDRCVADARAILGDSKIIGASVQTVEQAIEAQRDGADYLGVGAVFATGSKSDADSVDRETLTEICRSVTIPVIAIGGITAENISELKGSGICGVAVISAILAQKDPREASMRLCRAAVCL